jgi:hypothetical protein
LSGVKQSNQGQIDAIEIEIATINTLIYIKLEGLIADNLAGCVSLIVSKTKK